MNAGEEPGVTGETIESMAIGELAGQDPLGPCVVETHISRLFNKVWSAGEAGENQQPREEGEAKKPGHRAPEPGGGGRVGRHHETGSPRSGGGAGRGKSEVAAGAAGITAA